MVLGHSSQSENLIRNTIFWFPALTSLFYVAIGAPGLPAKYRWDSNVIQQAASGVREVDSAYQFIANIYATFSLSSEPWLSSIASFIPFLALQGIIFFRFAPRKITATIALFVICIDILGAVYLGQMTKELFMLILPIGFLMSPRTRIPVLVAVVIPGLIIALQMRSYWLLVVCLFLISLWLSRRGEKFNVLTISIAVVVAYLIVPRLFFATQGFELEEVRLSLNFARLDSESAQSAIMPLLDYTNPINQFVNLIIILFTLLVPLPLLLTGQLVHAVFALFILYLSLSVIKTVRYLMKYDNDIHSAASYHLLFAYLIIQAIFEPDYGSYLRHLTPLLLFGLLLILKKEVHIQETRLLEIKNSAKAVVNV